VDETQTDSRVLLRRTRRNNTPKREHTERNTRTDILYSPLFLLSLLFDDDSSYDDDAQKRLKTRRRIHQMSRS
jgi:hypothetical protein